MIHLMPEHLLPQFPVKVLSHTCKYDRIVCLKTGERVRKSCDRETQNGKPFCLKHLNWNPAARAVLKLMCRMEHADSQASRGEGDFLNHNTKKSHPRMAEILSYLVNEGSTPLWKLRQVLWPDLCPHDRSKLSDRHEKIMGHYLAALRAARKITIRNYRQKNGTTRTVIYLRRR